MAHVSGYEEHSLPRDSDHSKTYLPLHSYLTQPLPLLPHPLENKNVAGKLPSL